MKSLVILAVFMIFLFAVSSFAEFKDMRMIDNTPQSFEKEVRLEDFFRGSLVRFYKGHPLLWEASDIRGIDISGGKLTGFIHNDVIHLSDNLCGGLVAPVDAVELVYFGDFLLVATESRYYVYYVPECASYLSVKRLGYKADISDKMICEAGYNRRYVRSMISGEVFYSDNKNSIDTVSVGESCYFINIDGTIDVLEKDGGSFYSKTVFDIGEDIYWGGRYHNINPGFAGFTRTRTFNVEFSGSSISADFRELPYGVCEGASISGKPYCEADYDDSLKGHSFDQVFITADEILMKSDDEVKAYALERQWVKELFTSYSTPAGCAADDGFYFLDPLKRGWRVESDKEILSEVPEDCVYNVVYYYDGAFFSKDDELIYRYAVKVREEGIKALYMKRNDNEIIYMVE